MDRSIENGTVGPFFADLHHDRDFFLRQGIVHGKVFIGEHGSGGKETRPET